METLFQILIPIFWLPGSALVLHTRYKTFGYFWAICGYPFSIYSVAQHGQFGLLTVEVISCIIWSAGLITQCKNKFFSKTS
jgi:hypothetical protein